MQRLANIVLPLSYTQCKANIEHVQANIEHVLWHRNVTVLYPQDEVNLNTSFHWQRKQMGYTETCELSLFSFPYG